MILYHNRLVNQRRKHLLIVLFALLSISCGMAGRLASTGEDALAPTPTRTAWPTFTPTAPFDIASFMPTPTNTPAPTDTPPPTATPTESPPTATPAEPASAPEARVTTASLNVRSGPGTAYSRLGQVTNGHTSDVLGRNDDNSWILINYSGGKGWVSATYAQIEGDIDSVEVVEVAPPPRQSAPPPANPPPASAQASNPPPAPAGPSYAYKLTNVFGEKNGAITQIRGHIKDSNGQPANGVRVRVRIGSFCTVSVPSGKSGVYPPGNYDILLRDYASDGVWQVSIVDRPTDPEDHSCDLSAQQLSEEVRVTTSREEGVTYVEFQKQ
jgi:uncharacterized protein YraI